jgi:hypothetical protein
VNSGLFLNNLLFKLENVCFSKIPAWSRILLEQLAENVFLKNIIFHVKLSRHFEFSRKKLFHENLFFCFLFGQVSIITLKPVRITGENKLYFLYNT